MPPPAGRRDDTDSPTGGHVVSPGPTGDGATHTQAVRLDPPEEPEPDPSLYAVEHRAPTDVDLKDLRPLTRSIFDRSLTPTPDTGALTIRRRSREEDQNPELPGLTDPAPSGMTSGFTIRPQSLIALGGRI